MKKIYLFFFPFLIASGLILSTSGCKLDKPIFPNGADSLKTGGGTTGGSTSTSADSYQPIAKSTFWKYTVTLRDPLDPSNPPMTQMQTITMNGGTITINGKLYNKATNVVDNSTGYAYFYHGNDTYSYRSDLINPGEVLEYVYLKDNVAIGTTWTTPVTDNGQVGGSPAQLIGKIVEKDITKTISGKTFINVTHTQLLLQFDLGNGFTTYQTMDYYIAKGVGIVQIYTKNSVSSSIISDTLITDYAVK